MSATGVKVSQPKVFQPKVFQLYEHPHIPSYGSMGCLVVFPLLQVRDVVSSH